jgi:DNA-binding MarR family transcriptional regulator
MQGWYLQAQRHVRDEPRLARPKNHDEGGEMSAPVWERRKDTVTPIDEFDPVIEAVGQWNHERPDLDASPMLVFGRIARIFTLQRAAQAKVHSPYGLSHAAFDMLANLRRSGPPHRKTASELARSSMISTGGATMRMDGLEESGLIRRVRDREDRRLVYAELTDKGLAVIDEAIERHLGLLNRLLSDLSERERRQLAWLLAQLERSITHHTPQGLSQPGSTDR